VDCCNIIIIFLHYEEVEVHRADIFNAGVINGHHMGADNLDQ